MQDVIGSSADADMSRLLGRRDALKTPYGSCEWPYVGLTIAISDALNEYFSLPGKHITVDLRPGDTVSDVKAAIAVQEGLGRDQQDLFACAPDGSRGVLLSNADVLTGETLSAILCLRDSNCESWVRIFGSPTEWKDVAKALNRVRLSFRINVRFLAHIRTSCVIAVLLAYLCMTLGLVSTSSFSTLLLLLATPFYYGSFTFLPLREKYL
jgi:hypothetical protein